MLNENLVEKVLNRDNLIKAYKRVKANKGAPGVDGMSVEAFADHAKAETLPSETSERVSGHVVVSTQSDVTDCAKQHKVETLGIMGAIGFCDVLQPAFEPQIR